MDREMAKCLEHLVLSQTSEGLVAFLLHFQGREKFSRLTTGKWPQNYIFPELGKSCHMETARSFSLHCRLVDTGAELKLKPFGSQNSQISIGRESSSPPHALCPTAKSLEREGTAGFGGSFWTLHKKGIPSSFFSSSSSSASWAQRSQ